MKRCLRHPLQCDLTGAHIIVCPKLQARRADAENTGEELVGLEDLGNVEVLCQGRELFTQVSHILRV